MVLEKAPCVTLSSCEDEYIVGSYVACQEIWIVYMMEEMEVEVKKPLLLQIDNKSPLILQIIQFCMGEVSTLRLHFIS